jgi:hypothetical protein
VSGWRFARSGWTLAAALCTGCIVTESQAQTAAEPAAEFIYPAPARTFEAEGGYRFLQGDARDDESFYRVTYYGGLIDSRGEPLKSAEHLDLTIPKPAASAGDRKNLELQLQDGRSTLNGGLFEMNGAMPLRLRGIERLNLRGAAYLATDLDGERTKASVGLESPPIRVPGAAKLQAANYLIFGIMAERDDATDAAADANYALATGRFFIGKALGMHRHPNRDAIAHSIALKFLEQAPTRADAVALAQPLRKINAEDLTDLQTWLLDAVDDTTESTDWKQTILARSDGIADAISERPTASVYLEGSGWYANSSQSNEPKSRGLLSLTTDYWPLETRDDIILRARYEWGFERLQPNLRINQFTVSMTVQF